MLDVIKELERNKIAFMVRGDFVALKCPFHDDGSPSCFVKTRTGSWNCKGAQCHAYGDFTALIAKITNRTRAVVFADLSQRYGLEVTRSIDPRTVEKWSSDLWEKHRADLIKELHIRGVPDSLIRKYNLGANMGRIVIPIQQSGYWINAKFYLPGATDRPKMLGQKGRNDRNYLFPEDQLRYNKLILCGGEIKAMAVESVCEGTDFGAVSTIFGEGSWDDKYLTPQIAGKQVYIAMDVDKGGQIAAESLCHRLHKHCEVFKLQFSFPKGEYPKGGIDDYIVNGGDIFELIANAKRWTPPDYSEVVAEINNPSDPVDTDVRGFKDVKLVGRPLQMKALVTAVDANPYAIPKRVQVRCPANKEYCAVCGVFNKHPPVVDLAIDANILGMVGASATRVKNVMKEACGIPACCKVCEVKPLEHRMVFDTRVTSRIDVTSEDATTESYRCLFVDRDEVEINTSYDMEMRTYPHPDTQIVTGVVSGTEPLEDSLTPIPQERLPALKVFQASGDTAEAITEKLYSIADSMARDVTRIFLRPDMHIFADLVWHSPLLIKYGDQDTKGWLDALMIGDSSQGKSHFTKALQRHYQMGYRMDCKNATTAGVIGGLQQLANRWFTTWGIVPQNDKRMCIMEECKGIQTETIGKMTDGRSEGIVQLQKIERKFAYMRTRLLWVSNPRRNGVSIADYPYGILTIKELFGQLEDVRRLDGAIVIAKEAVSNRDISAADEASPKPETPEYLSDQCKDLITWAWTRTRDQVDFTPEAVLACNAATEVLAAKFSDVVPLLDRGSSRLKLARWAAALAARLFSTDESMEKIIVTPAHVQCAASLLDKWYSDPSCGYDKFSEAIRQADNLVSEDEVAKTLLAERYAKTMIAGLLNGLEFSERDIQDLGALDRFGSNDFISTLVRNRAMKRVNGRNTYEKHPAFTALLRRLHAGGDVVDSNIKDDF